MFPDAVVRIIEVSTSDHLPLFLDLNIRVYVEKRKHFKYENVWIKENDCYNIIKDCWTDESSGDILDKMGRCCVKLEEWARGG